MKSWDLLLTTHDVGVRNTIRGGSGYFKDFPSPPKHSCLPVICFAKPIYHKITILFYP